jgi:urease gamma subunit
MGNGGGEASSKRERIGVKIQNHEEATDAAQEILQTKNAGLTLQELYETGRVVDSDLNTWVRFYYAVNDMVYGGFFAERIEEILKQKLVSV